MRLKRGHQGACDPDKATKGRVYEFGLGQLIPEAEAKRWLGECGIGVILFRGCRISSPKRITVGDFSQIDEGVFLFPGEGISIGRHAHLAFGSSIFGGGRCEIGDFAGIGAGVRLITGTDLPDGKGLTNPTVPDAIRSVQRSYIKIGAHAVIYTNSIVLPGVTIGEGAVVAVGSVVHRNLKPWGIYSGNPLVQIGTRSRKKILQLAKMLRQSEAQ
jgi:galactoside O-acetyltransferase